MINGHSAYKKEIDESNFEFIKWMSGDGYEGYVIGKSIEGEEEYRFKSVSVNSICPYDDNVEWTFKAGGYAFDSFADLLRPTVNVYKAGGIKIIQS